VDAEEDPDEFSHVGHLYDGEPCEAMRAAFTPPYQPQVDTRLVTDAWGVFLTSYAPLLTSSGEFEGVLAMDMSAASIRRYERRCLLSIAAITLGVSLLAIALAVVLSHRVTRPLLLLAQDMDAVQRFQLDRQLPVRSRIREIDDMAHAVRAMKAGLLSFRRYVPADLVSELIRLRQDAVLGGERRQITTLFSDIRGFTAISERLPPEVLAGSLSAYFRTMTRTIVEHRGTVDKFVGDAIMAFWGAPAPVEDHALLACRAALACQRHLLSLNQEWRRQGLPALETRIGISTGEAIVGNIGYEERLSYTALGDSVNVASRAEGLNRHYGSRIVITEYTLRLVQDHVLARWLDRVAVKGRSEAVDIHELLAERDAATPEQVRFAEAVGQARGRYLRREWQAALEAFAAARALAPGDEATGLLAERCRAFLATPPPAAWDGATVMSEK
jgi:adenylate cyclase